METSHHSRFVHVNIRRNKIVAASVFSLALALYLASSSSLFTSLLVCQIIATAFQRNLDDGVLGSSTVCILSLDPTTATLSSANIGDSGFILVRPSTREVPYRSKHQEKSFGCPYQLGHHPNSAAADEAQLARQQLKQGDVVVLGSDGLFDNVSDGEVVELVMNMLTSSWEKASKRKRAKALEIVKAKELDEADMLSTCVSPSMLASSLAIEAYTASMDRKRNTPFSLSATEEFNMIFNGGKRDDITVCVGLVELDPSEL
jgi:protein phosphatase PTC7